MRMFTNTMATPHKKGFEESIAIPEGVEISNQGNTWKVKGRSGEVEKVLIAPSVTVTKQGNKLSLSTSSSSRKGKRMLYTFTAHMKNMVVGAQKGFTYRLKVCSGHFPITVKVEAKHVVISNFLGEKIPRTAVIMPNVNVRVEKDMIIVTSPDKEAAGQTAASIERATNVGKRDVRIFQDGCYITEKPERGGVA